MIRRRHLSCAFSALAVACAPVPADAPAPDEVIVTLCRLDDLAVGSALVGSRELTLAGRHGAPEPGTRLGHVTAIDGEPGRWRVHVRLSESGGWVLRAGDTLEVRSPGILGRDVLEILPGDSAGGPVAPGSVVTGRARLATAAQRRATVKAVGAAVGAAGATRHVPPGSFAPDRSCNATRTGPGLPDAR